MELEHRTPGGREGHVSGLSQAVFQLSNAPGDDAVSALDLDVHRRAAVGAHGQILQGLVRGAQLHVLENRHAAVGLQVEALHARLHDTDAVERALALWGERVSRHGPSVPGEVCEAVSRTSGGLSLSSVKTKHLLLRCTWPGPNRMWLTSLMDELGETSRICIVNDVRVGNRSPVRGKETISVRRPWETSTAHLKSLGKAEVGDVDRNGGVRGALAHNHLDESSLVARTRMKMIIDVRFRGPHLGLDRGRNRGVRFLRQELVQVHRLLVGLLPLLPQLAAFPGRSATGTVR
jgi:hypothetical protein